MEPVSLAVGVVPLAMNIVQMSSAIREKVSTYKSAPSDIQGIVDKTTLIGDICERLDLELFLSARKPRHQVEVLERALRMCCSSVASVEKDIDKITKTTNTRRQSLKYLIGKSNVEKSLYNLNDSINMLNTCISMSLLISSNHCQALAPTKSPKASQAPCAEDSLVPTTTPTQCKRNQIVKSNTLTRANALFYFQFGLSSSRDYNDGSKESYRQTYLFGLPLIGTYVSLAMRYGSLNPFELAIDIPQLIFESNNKSLFDKIINGDHATAPGDEQVRWAREMHLTGNTRLVTLEGWQVSMLGVTASTGSQALFSHFLNEGSRALEDENHLFNIFKKSIRHGAEGFDCDPMWLYVNMRGPFLTMNEYHHILIGMRCEKFCEAAFNACREYFMDEWEEFLVVSMKMLVKVMLQNGFSKGPQSPSYYYGPFARRILASGFGAHQPLIKPYSKEHPFRPPPELTSLHKIITCHREWEPLDTLAMAYEWLEILSQGSVELGSYLRKELEIQLQHADKAREVPIWWSSASTWTKLEFIYDILRPNDRLPEDEESTDELFQLLPAFRRVLVCSHPIGSENRSYSEWKNGFSENCPFAHLHFHAHTKAMKLANERFERNQNRKWEKLKKLNKPGEMPGVMPGSWRMEWREYQGPW